MQSAACRRQRSVICSEVVGTLIDLRSRLVMMSLQVWLMVVQSLAGILVVCLQVVPVAMSVIRMWWLGSWSSFLMASAVKTWFLVLILVLLEVMLRCWSRSSRMTQTLLCLLWVMFQLRTSLIAWSLSLSLVCWLSDVTPYCVLSVWSVSLQSLVQRSLR